MNCDDYQKMDVLFTKKGDLVYNQIKPEQTSIDFIRKIRGIVVSNVTDPKEIIRACFSGTAWHWLFHLNKYPCANVVRTRFALYAFDGKSLNCLSGVMNQDRVFHLDSGYAIYIPETLDKKTFMALGERNVLVSHFYDVGEHPMVSSKVKDIVEKNGLTGVVFRDVPELKHCGEADGISSV